MVRVREEHPFASRTTVFLRSSEQFDLDLLAGRRQISRDGCFGFTDQRGFDACPDGIEFVEDLSTAGFESWYVFVGATVGGVGIANVEPWAMD